MVFIQLTEYCLSTLKIGEHSATDLQGLYDCNPKVSLGLDLRSTRQTCLRTLQNKFRPHKLIKFSLT